MTDKAKEYHEMIRMMDLSEVKKMWKLDEWEDEQAEDYRRKFLRLKDELDEIILNLKEGEFVSPRLYEKGNRDMHIIPFIGKIGNIDAFAQKYLGYDPMVIKLMSKYPDSNKHVRETFFEPYSHDTNDYFFIRLIQGKRNDSDPIMRSLVQVFGFNYDDRLEKIECPWMSEWSEFITDHPYIISTLDECMSNIDTFIKQEIDENPVFGIEKIDKELNKD